MTQFIHKPFRNVVTFAFLCAIAALFISHPNTSYACDTCGNLGEKENMDETMKTAEDQALKDMDDDMAESNYDSCQKNTDGGADDNLNGASGSCPSSASADNSQPIPNMAQYDVRPAGMQIAETERSCIIARPGSVFNSFATAANTNVPNPTHNYVVPVSFMGNTPRPQNLYSDITHVALDMSTVSSLVGPLSSAFTSIAGAGGMGDIMKKFCESNPGGAGICAGMQGSSQTGAQGLGNMKASWKRPKSGDGATGKPKDTQKTNQRKMPNQREPQEKNDCTKNNGFGCNS